MSQKRRIHQLSLREIKDWQEARMQSGAEKYHSLDHTRDQCIDIMEELLDSFNILQRYIHHHPFPSEREALILKKLHEDLKSTILKTIHLDRIRSSIPIDRVERIYFDL